MNINDLLEILQDAAETHGGETEVRLALQPSWPLVARTDSAGVSETDGEPVFFIAQGEELGYGSSDLWALGY